MAGWCWNENMRRMREEKGVTVAEVVPHVNADRERQGMGPVTAAHLEAFEGWPCGEGIHRTVPDGYIAGYAAALGVPERAFIGTGGDVMQVQDRMLEQADRDRLEVAGDTLVEARVILNRMMAVLRQETFDPDVIIGELELAREYVGFGEWAIDRTIYAAQPYTGQHWEGDGMDTLSPEGARYYDDLT